MSDPNADRSNEINVAKYIISQTPIGHLTQSLENLATVVGEEVMDTPQIKEAVQNYTEDHLSHFPNDSTKLIVSKLNKDSSNTYYDQSQGIKFSLSEDCKDKANVEPCDDTSSLRKAIDSSLQTYKEKYYKSTVTTSNVFYDETNGDINVIISAHNINMKNFWSGEWLSTWTYKNGNVKGTIKANTYYYEEGNSIIVHGGRNDKSSDNFALDDTYILELYNLNWLRVEYYFELENGPRI